ncbi:proton-coupled amino acid transporter 3-like [Ylistrum balloti]|uniref:proton-coupled amino acid transporter 3-like n=1 Tax=Ylistrum balloti TaxID=509963 RepID=UPI002905A476|nr:proton-coupled amino acid transporter 3-like [Ylistrum balloti]
MLLIPTYIGIGFPGLPYMVKLLGLWFGSSGLLIYGFMNELGALVLTDCTSRLTERTGESFGDTGRVAEMSMKLGPPCLQSYAGKFRFSVTCTIFISYILFLPDLIATMNLFAKDILHQYVDINDTLLIVVISVLLLPVYLTRRMKLLSYLATAGNIILLLIIIISFKYICRDLPDINSRSATKFIDFLTITSFMNDVMFSYDGIAMVLPIRSRMKSTKHFDGWNGVLGLALVMVVSFHVACGFFGYLKFGELTQVNYILNLTEDGWISKSLKILSFLTSYLTIGTVVFVIVEMLWTYLKEKFTNAIVQNYGEYICRGILLILSCAFTILIPQFQLLISLTGCFCANYITLVVPFTMKMLMLYNEEEPMLLAAKLKRKITLICCGLILLVGIYSVITGTCVALYMAMWHIVL